MTWRTEDRGSPRVFAWESQRAPACAWYRLRLPLRTLGSLRGWDTAVRDRIPMGRLLDVSGRPVGKNETGTPGQSDPLGHWRDYDVVIGQRIGTPGATQTWQEVCADPSTLAVYELDDDLLNIPEWSHTTRQAYDGEARENTLRCMRAADRVVVTTEPLRERVIEETGHTDVRVVPNYVDESTLELPAVDTSRPVAGDGAGWVVVGWQGSPTHQRDFQEAAPAVARLLRTCGRSVFVTMGTDYREQLGRLPADVERRTGAVPWVHVTADHGWDEYYGTVAQLDVGLAPLVTHTFNDSKSWVKVLELMALGIPWVASAERPYRDLVRAGELGERNADACGGYLVRREHEWLKALRDLVNDDELRAVVGKNGRRWASYHTVQGHVDEWEAALTP